MANGQGNITGRIVPAGNGWQWIAGAWNLFKPQAANWVLVFVVFLLIILLLGWLRPIGNLVMALLSPIFVGGLMLGARACDQGGKLEIAHLFSGFREKTANLALVGVFNLVASLAVVLVVGLLMGFGTGMGAMMGGMAGSETGPAVGTMAGMSFSMLVGALLGAALSVPIAAAIWFAPALIVFRDAAPLDALKTSFFACLRNILPFAAYGVFILILGVLASIPLGLGWLVLGPVLTLSVYTAYRDVFGA